MMSAFHGISDYLSVTELDADYCRFKIYYRALERVMHFSTFYSPEVDVGGVGWSLRYTKACYPMTVVSFSIYFGTLWDFRKTFDISLLDKEGKPVITASLGAYNYTIPLLVPKIILENMATVDGCLFILCKVSGAVPERPRQEISVSLPVQLRKILDDDEMTDTTLEVNGEFFYAHRTILGARSPVFKAQLFGSMIESKLRFIRIKDMETEVFKYLLQYIYTDTIDGNPEIPSTKLAQNLLVAADRYEIEGLKIKCEEKLSKDVSLESVLSCFALAEQYYCSKLKEACFKFASKPANLGNLVFTEEYLQFMQNYPDLVAELRNRSGDSQNVAQNI